MSTTPLQSRQHITQIDLRDFPARLRVFDHARLTHWEKDYRCISRDKLSPEEIDNMTEIKEFICSKMDAEQKDAFASMFDETNEDQYNIFDTDIGHNDVIKMPITLLNAPAGTGKTMVTLAYQIAINLKFGYKNGAIMYTPSYASLDAVVDKISECFEEIYGGDCEIITEKTKCVRNCLSINIINHFYACGPQSFNIHDQAVAAKVIQKFGRANCKKGTDNDLYKLNNVQAIRESRAIICDEAFFSTKNRCHGFIDMLMDGYIDHPYLNAEIRSEFPNLIDHLVYRKKIVFSGDPYQLSVSVEQKDAGVEKYLIEEGCPLWHLKNKLRDCVRLSENVNDDRHYQILTLVQNYRFGPDVPADLRDTILDIRKVVYKDENGFEEYKERMRCLLKCMSNHNMIQFGQRPSDVADRIDSEDKHRLYTVSEVHAASKTINTLLDKKSAKRHTPFIVAKTKFVYGQKLGAELDWVDYGVYLNALYENGDSIDYTNEFVRRYESECKNGVIANKFIGAQYPAQHGERGYTDTKLYIGDKVRITIPLMGDRHGVTRVLNDSQRVKLPDAFKLHTGTFGSVVGFDGTTVFVEICNEDDADKYNKLLADGKQCITLNTGVETSNPVFAIKYSEDLNDPYFKSAFSDYIIREKSFNVAVHSYPFTKESASTIHSLQGKTMSKKEKIIYYMHSIKKVDLYGVIFNEVGAWKGCLPNLLYVALTRSKVPHTNFLLMTSAKNITELLKNITSGKRPKSYNDLREFNANFEQIHNK